MRKPSSESSDVSSETSDDLTLKIASTQVVETSVTNNSPSHDSNHPDDLFQSRHVTPGLKPFSYNYTAESLFAGDNTDLEKKCWCFACTLCARDILRQFHCVPRISLRYVVLKNYFNNILPRSCLSTHHYKFKEVCISFIFKVNI